MCKHDVMTIRRAHCSLEDCKQLVQASASCNWYSYVPNLRLRTCQSHCLSLAATSSSQFAYVQIWRHPQNRKRVNVSLHCQTGTEPWPQVTCTKNLTKIGGVVPKIRSWTDKHTHRQTRSSQYSSLLDNNGQQLLAKWGHKVWTLLIFLDSNQYFYHRGPQKFCAKCAN